MDMWSVGCIFGELLQRMERAGASFTPKLTIMPVFQFSNWSPPTPVPGSTYQDGVLAGKVCTHHALCWVTLPWCEESATKNCFCLFTKISTHPTGQGVCPTVKSLSIMMTFIAHGVDYYFATPTGGMLVQELEAIFEVIGSPEWSCIEAVESEAWRRFLWQVPATAPHLHRRFGFAGEPAVDLLRRLLAFDPHRRCSFPSSLTHVSGQCYPRCKLLQLLSAACRNQCWCQCCCWSCVCWRVHRMATWQHQTLKPL